jgi:hypothetical protein
MHCIDEVQFPPVAVLFWQVVAAEVMLSMQYNPKLQDGSDETVKQGCPNISPWHIPPVQLPLAQSVFTEHESPGP